MNVNVDSQAVNANANVQQQQQQQQEQQSQAPAPQQPLPLQMQPQPLATNVQMQAVVCYDAQGNQLTVYQPVQPAQRPQMHNQGNHDNDERSGFIASAGEPPAVQGNIYSNANETDFGCGEDADCECNCSGVTWRNSLACAVGILAALLLVVGLGSDEYTKYQVPANWNSTNSTGYSGCDLICRSTQIELDCAFTSSALDYEDYCDDDNPIVLYQDFCNLQAMGALAASLFSIALVLGLVAVAYSQPCKPLRLKGNGCCCRKSNFPIILFSVSAVLCVVGELLFVYGQDTICSPNCDDDLYGVCAEVETTLALADVCAVFYVICAVLICCCSRRRKKDNYAPAPAGQGQGQPQM